MFLEFFKTGLFAVGGGLATIPFLREIGVRYGWYTMSDLSTMIAVSESTPGPMGVNMASYVGFSQYGVLGSIVVTLGLVLPSLIIICIIANFLEKFKEAKLVQQIFAGLKPAVVGLIGSAVISMSSTVFIPQGFNTTVFTDISFYTTLIIFLISVVLAFKKLNPILIICLSAILGIVCGYI
jgi:chromate transporter